jgi:hypothetical protein
MTPATALRKNVGPPGGRSMTQGPDQAATLASPL